MRCEVCGKDGWCGTHMDINDDNQDDAETDPDAPGAPNPTPDAPGGQER